MELKSYVHNRFLQLLIHFFHLSCLRLELKLLYSYDFIPFKEFPKPKYPDGFLIHWIIDDMLGTNIFKNGRSTFTNLCIRNRHIIPGNIIIAIQSIMSVPKTIRLNLNGRMAPAMIFQS